MERKIDIMSSWTNYTKRNESVSLNFDKYDKMKEQDAVLYIFDVYNFNLLKIDIRKDIYKAEKRYGKNYIYIDNKKKKTYYKECYFNYNKCIINIKRR